MWKCIKCGRIIEDDMIFCPECGTRYVIHDTNVRSLNGCPIVLVEQNLFVNENVVNISLSFCNVGNMAVNAVSIRLKCFDQLKDELADTIVKYSDLYAENGESFGEEKIVVPADSDTRNFEVIIEKVLLENGTLYKGNGDSLKVDSTASYNQAVNQAKSEKQKSVAEQTAYEDEELEREIIRQKQPEAEKIWKTLKEMNSEYVDKLMHAWFGKQQDKAQKNYYQKRNQFVAQHPDIIVPYNASVKDVSFEFCETLKSIYIPDCNHNIELNFSWCKQLVKVRLPNGIEEINDNFFSYCESLREIRIPASVKRIHKGAFSGDNYNYGECKNLEKAYVPFDTIVEDGAFPNFTEIIKI